MSDNKKELFKLLAKRGTSLVFYSVKLIEYYNAEIGQAVPVDYN